MRTTIIQFFKGNRREDTLLFYYSGHGVPDGRGKHYLAPSDIDPNSPFSKGIDFEDLQYIAEGSNSNKRLTILDCCFSGAAGVEGLKGGDDIAKEARDAIDRRMKESEGTYLLASSLAYQQSVIKKELNHSLFTYFLLEGLKGKKRYMDEYGHVTADNLHNYIFDKMLEEKRVQQKPIKKARVSGDITVAYHPELAEVIAPSADVSELISEGNQYFGDKRYEEAIEKFNEILSSNPKNYSAYKLKGDALVKLNKIPEGLECYDKALEIKKDYAYALREKGLALYKISNFEEAINPYDKALKIDSKDAISWNYKGLTFKDLGKYENAIEYFNEAIRLNPEYNEALKNKESIEILKTVKISDGEISSAVGEDRQLISISEEDWSWLLYSINDLNCLPFVGNGVCSPFLPLNSEIANDWAKKYGYPLNDSGDLARVAEFLAFESGNPLSPKTRLAAHLKKLYPSPPCFSSEELMNTPYAVLSDLNLPIYITTNYDNFMEKALENRDRKKTIMSGILEWDDNVKKYLRSRGVESIFAKDSKYKPTPHNPLVYHLYGDMNIPWSMVITQQDHDDFAFNLSRMDKENVPPQVIRAIATSALLFIGYEIEDRSFRTILSYISHIVVGGLREEMVVVLTPPSGNNANRQRRYLETYFRSLKARVYWGSASSFCYELRKRWESYKNKNRDQR